MCAVLIGPVPHRFKYQHHRGELERGVSSAAEVILHNAIAQGEEAATDHFTVRHFYDEKLQQRPKTRCQVGEVRSRRKNTIALPSRGASSRDRGR